jgi:glycolate oxidase FAD binding subunit
MTNDSLFPPQTEEALTDLLRAFAAQGRSVRVAGGGTQLHHVPPFATPNPKPETLKPSVAVSMRGLNRIIHHEPGDLVISVQCGARLADVQAELAKHGQWLPIDPPYADATIGGILATNTSGPRRLAYGTMRDLLIGLRVAGPGGVVTKSGGRVVKNVTGYDVHKLHIGAFGTLGALLEANFKVRPKPDLSALFLLAFDRFVDAHAALLKIHASPLRPVALEALDTGAAEALRNIVGAQHAAPLPGDALALVGVEGTQAVVDRHARDLPSVVGATQGSPLRVDGAAAAALWSALRDLPERRKAFVRVRVGAKPHDLPGVLAGCIPRASAWARAGTGLAWLDLDPAPGLPDRIAAWHAKAAAAGGYAVVESAPVGMPGREQLPWNIPERPLSALERKIREACGGNVS